MPMEIAAVDAGGQILAVNEAWRRFAQQNGAIDPSAGVGTNYLAVCDAARGFRADEAAAVAQGIRSVLSGQRTQTQSTYPCHAPDRERWFEVHVTRWERAGEAAGAMVIHKDVTGRRQAEWCAHNLLAQTEQIIESISSILIAVDAEDRIFRWNETAEQVFHLSFQKVVGHPILTCGIQWDWATVLEAVLQCLDSRRPVRLDDIKFTRQDGSEGFLGLTLNSTERDAGKPTGYLIIGAEVTERRVLEAQLRQAHKLEAIGQLAAGIAHEINTPTQYVGDNIRFLQDSFNDLSELLAASDRLRDAVQHGGEAVPLVAEVQAIRERIDLDYLLGEIPSAISQSLDGVERVTKIVRAMKEFSHPGGDERRPTDINQAIASTITVARNEWKYVAELEMNLDPAVTMVPCLPGDFNQVILNIVVNAAQAIADRVKGTEEKGQIIISTQRDGDWAEIRISDTGGGIPESARAHIFEPFFTTKEVGKGTGQGLAISHSVIVKKHGGTLDFETKAGEGTTFIIRLPLGEESPLHAGGHAP